LNVVELSKIVNIESMLKKRLSLFDIHAIYRIWCNTSVNFYWINDI